MTVLVKVKGTFSSLGSAVWIGKQGYLATCYHVVRDISAPLVVGVVQEPVFSGGRVNMAITGVAAIFDVKVAAYDESTDVAILKADKLPEASDMPTIFGVPGLGDTTPGPRGAALSTSALKPGDSLLLAGYPLDRSVLVLQTGIYTGEGDFTLGADLEKSPPANGRRLILSLVSNFGNSGGPVFDGKGAVVGLLEGNLPSPVRDMDNKQFLLCLRYKLDSENNEVVGPDGKPLLEPTPCQQNSGISIAVPAQFIARLAKEKGLDVR